MRLLFVTHGWFYPHQAGGAELSTLHLMDRLRRNRWAVEALCTAPHPEPDGSLSPLEWQPRPLFPEIPSGVTVDWTLGFPCWRQFSGEPMGPLLDRRLRLFQPDVVLGQLGGRRTVSLLGRAARRGLPGLYLVWGDREIRELLPLPKGIGLLASSPFIASLVSRVISGPVETVLPPVDPARYKVKRRRRAYLTFINPIPGKGLNVAVEIARRLPRERFLFVEGGWGNMKVCRRAIRDLPNVELWPYQKDMRRVYSVTDLLLAPSWYRESFCRVILEAQISGIPVIASDRGSIPYTLGKGGIVIRSKEGPGGYVNAVRRLRASPRLYRKLSGLAIENSRRPEFRPELQVENFARLLERGLRAPLRRR